MPPVGRATCGEVSDGARRFPMSAVDGVSGHKPPRRFQR